ncbi:MAG TPA: hypothetical protein VJI98_05950 [Candidatus Nanoarchaeia archaeon]|nr:hypothetical protein [Candidatus Nanoarchaeia archaeon]
MARIFEESDIAALGELTPNYRPGSRPLLSDHSGDHSALINAMDRAYGIRSNGGRNSINNTFFSADGRLVVRTTGPAFVGYDKNKLAQTAIDEIGRTSYNGYRLEGVIAGKIIPELTAVLKLTKP